MEPKRTLSVGLDLNDDVSLLSCFSEKTFEPEPIQKEEGKDTIPTVMAYKADTGEWLSGEEAIKAAASNSAELVDHFIRRMADRQAIELHGTVLEDTVVMEKFLRKVLSLLKIYYPNDSILKLTVTIGYMEHSLISAIYKALSNMGIKKDRALVISHEQAYLYYALSQKKELWMNDIGLFEFDERGLSYHQISINRRTMPMVVSVDHKDFSDTLSYELLLEQQKSGGAGYIFENIAKKILYEQIVSTLYLIGKGFEGDWLEEVLKEFCAGRRIFVGQNLFTKGACYASRETALLIKQKEGKFKDFIFLSSEMICVTLSTKVYYNARIQEIILIKAGIPWYEADMDLFVIREQEDSFEIYMKDVINRTKDTIKIDLGEMADRPAATSRLHIHIHFDDPKTFIITIRDKGFGDMYPTSNRIWEKRICLT